VTVTGEVHGGGPCNGAWDPHAASASRGREEGFRGIGNWHAARTLTLTSDSGAGTGPGRLRQSGRGFVTGNRDEGPEGDAEDRERRVQARLLKERPGLDGEGLEGEAANYDKFSRGGPWTATSKRRGFRYTQQSTGSHGLTMDRRNRSTRRHSYEHHGIATSILGDQYTSRPTASTLRSQTNMEHSNTQLLLHSTTNLGIPCAC